MVLQIQVDLVAEAVLVEVVVMAMQEDLLPQKEIMEVVVLLQVDLPDG
jgi:hypothetical protein